MSPLWAWAKGAATRYHADVPISFNLFLNGESRRFDVPLTVQDLLRQAGYAAERPVAVEVNGEVVPKSRHGALALVEGDRVEIIQAIGGG
jgi:sulfur carrier protein